MILIAAIHLAEGVEPVGTPFFVPLALMLLMLFIFGWGVVQRSWQTTVFDQEEAVRLAEAARLTEAARQAEAAQQAQAARQAEAAAKTEPDNLQRIEGIGPKIEALLVEAGISTYAQLAETDLNTLNRIVVEEAGLSIADPTTWPEQAALADAGRWADLAELQEQLQGGRST